VGEDEDDGQIGGGEHDSEQDRDERDRQLQRQRHEPELLQPCRTVDLCRVLDLARDRRQAGEVK